MNISDPKIRAWQNRPSDSDNVFYDREPQDYTFATILPHATKSRRRVNYSTIFLIVTAVFFAVSYIFFR